MLLQDIEAVAQRCSVENVFLEISQNSQENTWKKLRKPFFIERLWWLLLKTRKSWKFCIPLICGFLDTQLCLKEDVRDKFSISSCWKNLENNLITITALKKKLSGLITAIGANRFLLFSDKVSVVDKNNSYDHFDWKWEWINGTINIGNAKLLRYLFHIKQTFKVKIFRLLGNENFCSSQSLAISVSVSCRLSDFRTSIFW